MTLTARLAATALLAALLASTSACGGKKKPEPGLWKPDEVDVTAVGAVGSYVEPTKFEQGVGMHAATEDDGTVVVSIRNNSADVLDLQARLFAVIAGPNKSKDTIPVSYASADLARFVPERVPPKGTAVIAFRMRDIANPSGMRLVMREPARNLMFFVDIE